MTTVVLKQGVGIVVQSNKIQKSSVIVILSVIAKNCLYGVSIFDGK